MKSTKQRSSAKPVHVWVFVLGFVFNLAALPCAGFSVAQRDTCTCAHVIPANASQGSPCWRDANGTQAVDWKGSMVVMPRLPAALLLPTARDGTLVGNPAHFHVPLSLLGEARHVDVTCTGASHTGWAPCQDLGLWWSVRLHAVRLSGCLEGQLVMQLGAAAQAGVPAVPAQQTIGLVVALGNATRPILRGFVPLQVHAGLEVPARAVPSSGLDLPHGSSNCSSLSPAACEAEKLGSTTVLGVYPHRVEFSCPAYDAVACAAKQEVVVQLQAASLQGVSLATTPTVSTWFTASLGQTRYVSAPYNLVIATVSFSAAALRPGTHRGTLLLRGVPLSGNVSLQSHAASASSELVVVPFQVTVVQRGLQTFQTASLWHVPLGLNRSIDHLLRNDGPAVTSWALTSSIPTPVPWVAVCVPGLRCAVPGGIASAAAPGLLRHIATSVGDLSTSVGLTGQLLPGQAVRLVVHMEASLASSSVAADFLASFHVRSWPAEGAAATSVVSQIVHLTVRTVAAVAVLPSSQLRIREGRPGTASLAVFPVLTSHVAGLQLRNSAWLAVHTSPQLLRRPQSQAWVSVSAQHTREPCEAADFSLDFLCGVVQEKAVLNVEGSASEMQSRAELSVQVELGLPSSGLSNVTVQGNLCDARGPASTCPTPLQRLAVYSGLEQQYYLLVRERDSIGAALSPTGMDPGSELRLYLPPGSAARGSVAADVLLQSTRWRVFAEQTEPTMFLAMPVLRGTPLQQGLGITQLAAVPQNCSGAGLAPSESSFGCTCLPGWGVSPGADASKEGLSPGDCRQCLAGSFAVQAYGAGPTCSLCPRGTFSLPGAASCRACATQGGACVAGHLRVQSGFWTAEFATQTASRPSHLELGQRILDLQAHRSALSPAFQEEESQAGPDVEPPQRFQQCWPREACITVPNSANMTCLEGHRGVLCGECLHGWARQSAAAQCRKCPPWAQALVLSLTGAFVPVLVIVFLVVRSNRAPKETSILVALFRIMTGWCQMNWVLSQLSTPPPTAWPFILDWLATVSMSPGFISIPSQCAWSMTSPYHRLAAVALQVVLLLGVLGCTTCCPRRKPQPGAQYASNALAQIEQHVQQAVRDLNAKRAPGIPRLGELHSHPPGPRATAVASLPELASQQEHAVVTPSVVNTGPEQETQVRHDSVQPPTEQHGEASVDGEFFDDASTIVVDAVDVVEPADEAEHWARPVHVRTAVDLDDTSATKNWSPAALVEPAKPQDTPGRRGFAWFHVIVLYGLFAYPSFCIVFLQVLDVIWVPELSVHLLRGDTGSGSLQALFTAALGTAAGLGFLVIILIPCCVVCYPSKAQRLQHVEWSRMRTGTLLAGLRAPHAQRHESMARDGKHTKPSCLAWELLAVLPQRTFLVAAVFLVRGARSQLAALLLLLTASFLVQRALKPYRSSALNTLESAVTLGLWLAAWSALVESDASPAHSTLPQVTLYTSAAFFALPLLLAMGLLLVLITSSIQSQTMAVYEWLQVFVDEHPSMTYHSSLPHWGMWCCTLGYRRSASAYLALLSCMTVPAAIEAAGDTKMLEAAGGLPNLSSHMFPHRVKSDLSTFSDTA